MYKSHDKVNNDSLRLSNSARDLKNSLCKSDRSNLLLSDRSLQKALSEEEVKHECKRVNERSLKSYQAPIINFEIEDNEETKDKYVPNSTAL